MPSRTGPGHPGSPSTTPETGVPGAGAGDDADADDGSDETVGDGEDAGPAAADAQPASAAAATLTQMPTPILLVTPLGRVDTPSGSTQRTPESKGISTVV